MIKTYLYKITNQLDGKVYVGITVDVNRRQREHFSGRKSSAYLQAAMSKYGKENFSFEILCAGDPAYIADLEVKAMYLYDSARHGYNITIAKDQSFQDLEVRRRSDDSPIYVDGFWFPAVRFAKRAFNCDIQLLSLQIGRRRLSSKSSELSTAKKSAMEGKALGELNPMYGKRNHGKRCRKVSVKGVTYPSLAEAGRESGWTKSQIEKRILKGNPDFFYL